MYSIKKSLLFVATLAGGFLMGGLFWSAERPSDVSTLVQRWSCPMHPQITSPRSGSCSICGMSLALRADAESSDALHSSTHIESSESLIAASNISTTVVQEGPLSPTIYLQGRVEVSPSQRYRLSTTYAARVEELYVDTEGEYLREGQPVARLYAPDLETAETAFLEASSSSEQTAWYSSTRAQLKDWGLSDAQIEALASSRKTSPYLELLASRSGHLLRVLAHNGETLRAGAPLYELADLSILWLRLEASPEDLPWLKKGIQIPFRRSVDNYARFNAELQEISVTSSTETGNLSLWALIHDPSPELRPGMYVESYLRPLTEAKGLVVPRSAILWTGKESVVYVRSREPSKRNHFSFRRIKLGERFGDYYLVDSGLEAGEEVVTEGALALDATMQLQGKVHMMSPSTTLPTTDRNKALTPPKRVLKIQLQAYFSLTEALIASDEATAQQSTIAFATALQKSSSDASYTELNKQLLPLLNEMKTSDLSKIRTLYAQVSDLWIEYLPQLGSSDGELYEVYCPMSLDNQGARWLWNKKEVLNPYFGSSMLKCGRVVGPIKIF